MILLKNSGNMISPRPIERASIETFSAKKFPHLKNPNIDKFAAIDMSRPIFRWGFSGVELKMIFPQIKSMIVDAIINNTNHGFHHA